MAPPVLSIEVHKSLHGGLSRLQLALNLGDSEVEYASGRKALA
jgi:hypothetical protein